MNEYHMIQTLFQDFSRSSDQVNDLFTCDAELIEIGEQVWGMTMDEFTPEEDMFINDNPAILGRNLAICTLSDLFSAGVTPRFYMHSIALPHAGAEVFSSQLVGGVRSVLEEVGCFLCGGDLGTAATWRYCGFGLGPVANRSISRVLPAIPQSLWITGSLGDANVAAIQGTQTPSFELRLAEAAFIRDYATGCIDTSGGFMDALWTLSSLNPKLRFTVNLADIPYAPKVIKFAKESHIPLEAALIGGAGEYELLFTVPVDTDVQGLDARKVGEVGPGEGGVCLVRDGRDSLMLSPPPCPRSFSNRDEYIKQVMEAAKALYE